MRDQALKYYFGIAATMGVLGLAGPAIASQAANIIIPAHEAAAQMCKSLMSAQDRQPMSSDVITLKWTNALGQLNRLTGPALLKCSVRTGRVLKEIWAVNGNLHNPSGPAYREYDQTTQNLRAEGWWLHGKQTRKDGPVFTIHDPVTQIVTTEEWRQNDVYFRDSGEATNLRRDSVTGIVILEEWAEGRQGEDLHRVGAPALVQRDPVSGIVVYEEWRQQDKFFRENDLPTRIWRHNVNGKVIREEWKTGYILDRTIGPAVIQYLPDGSAIQEMEYWQKGRKAQEIPQNVP